MLLLQPSANWEQSQPHCHLAYLMPDCPVQVSCDAYRAVVQKDERFIDYFGEATPVSELGRMNIGSRPAKRRVRPAHLH